MAKEIVYQAVDYLGIGRVLPFLKCTNEILTQRGVTLPLEGQSTATMENRLEKGAQAQADIFGPQMLEAWKAGHINRWLAANCFGDYYTRTGLTLAQREMITFCFLAAQGGCEPQLTSHAKGNMNLGNDRDFLIRVVSQCLPYIGPERRRLRQQGRGIVNNTAIKKSGISNALPPKCPILFYMVRTGTAPCAGPCAPITAALRGAPRRFPDGDTPARRRRRSCSRSVPRCAGGRPRARRRPARWR